MNDKKKIVLAGVSIFLALCGAITFYFLLFHWNNFSKTVKNIASIFSPVMLGFAIAYLLIPIMEWLEKRLVKPLFMMYRKRLKRIGEPSGKALRNTSIIITFVVICILITMFYYMLVPNLAQSIKTIVNQFPGYVDNFNDWINALVEDNPVVYDNIMYATRNLDFEKYINTEIVPKLNESLRSLSTGLISSVATVARGVGNCLIGIIVSIYIMAGKERFLAQFKKIIYSTFNKDRADVFMMNLSFIHHTFIGFISGKIVDSFIIGIICYILVLIIGLPFPELLSVVIGVTNVIPYFGPFLGAIPCALLILMVNPVQCAYFIVMIIILQQFDGNILGPKILGDSTGLSGFWVIFAITVFGNIFGVMGLFIGVPVFAVLYAFLGTIISQRLEEKGLPTNTDDYYDMVPVNYDSLNDPHQCPDFTEKEKNKKKSWTLFKKKSS